MSPELFRRPFLIQEYPGSLGIEENLLQPQPRTRRVLYDLCYIYYILYTVSFYTIYCILYILYYVLSSYSFWTSSWLDVPARVTQEEGRTGFFIHLPSAVLALVLLARRIQPFLSLIDRDVELCINDLIVLHSLGIFIYILFFS